MTDSRKKVAVVSGASAGIGRASARALHRLGATVIITEVRPKMVVAHEAAAEIHGLALELDLRDATQITECIASVAARYGRIDILVNNAGAVIRKPALEVMPDDWDAVLDVNLRGTFFMAQAAGRLMTNQRSGRIINIASIFGLVGGANRSAYAASKAGIVNLTRCLAIEWAPLDVQVNAVAPNVVRTPMTEDVLSDAATLHAVVSGTPVRRLATPEDVADVVAWLSLSAPSYITGVTVPVDGGWVAQ